MDLEVDTDAVSLSAGEGAELGGFRANLNLPKLQQKLGVCSMQMSLKSIEVYVRVHTGGEACVFAEESIEGKVGTGGQLDILGNPKRDYVTTNLGGNVRTRREM